MFNEYLKVYQSSRMAIYKWDNSTRPSMNQYPVYKGDNEEYFYLWDWGQGDGMNWFISDNVASDSRGVESPDMEFKQDKCPENINVDRKPFNVYTRRRQFDIIDPRYGWRADEGLRVECWNERINKTCCDSLIVRSSGPAATWQPDKMGEYHLWGGGSVYGRRVWKHASRQNFVYYWEWGVNTGTEWMLGHSPYSSERGIRSENMERRGDLAICVSDVPKVGEWQIYTEEEQWTTDDTFSVKCMENEDL